MLKLNENSSEDRMETKFEYSDYCFACGGLNPLGLHLQFSFEDGKLKTEFLPHQQFQGYQGLLHGGLVCTILDELMVHLVTRLFSKVVVTAELSVRFKRPVEVGRLLIAQATLIKHRKKVYHCTGELLEAENSNLIAEGKAMLVEPASHTEVNVC